MPLLLIQKVREKLRRLAPAEEGGDLLWGGGEQENECPFPPVRSVGVEPITWPGAQLPDQSE